VSLIALLWRSVRAVLCLVYYLSNNTHHMGLALKE